MHSVIDLANPSDQKNQCLLRTMLLSTSIVSGQMLPSIRIVSMFLSTIIESGQMLLSIRIVRMLLSTSIVSETLSGYAL